MSKFVSVIIGAAEITAGGILAAMGNPIGISLIIAGAGTVVSGIGTILSKGPLSGLATTVRNPTAPWKVVYGRVRNGGTLVYQNTWGDSVKMMDLVIVLAAHPCQSVDVLLFDMQRIQIDTSAAPAGAAAGSGTSFTPVQQTVIIAQIQRANNIVTVTLHSDIPYLIEGDRVNITDVPGDKTLNGVFQVAQILSRVGGIKFTYLSGGVSSNVLNAGHVHTLWADYGRKVYFEPLLGDQVLGQTFKGMFGTPYDGDRGNYVNPDNQKGLGGNTSNVPNPWTANHSLVGKTAVHLRLHYNDQVFKGGLPQISFLQRGKNDILDPRSSPVTHGYTENAALCIADFLSNKTWGYGAAYGTEIPYPDLIAAANVCDEAVPLALSTVSPPLTEPLWACNGQFEVTEGRKEILRKLLTSCAGQVTDFGGQFRIWPAAWRGNSFAIGSNPGGGVVSLPAFSQIAGPGPIRWRPTVSIRDLYNGVKGTYISQANKWMSSDFPPYCQDTLHGYSGPSLYGGDANLAADGGDRRWKDIQLPFTISSRQAQQTAKVELLRGRSSPPTNGGCGSGTLILNMVAYRIATLDLLLATIPYLNWTAKQLEVADMRFRAEESGGGALALVVELDVQETNPAIYEWSTSEELSPQGYEQPAIPGLGSFRFFATEKVPGYSVPFPLAPGYVRPLVGDGVFQGPVAASPRINLAPGSFGMQAVYGTDAQGNATTNLNIKAVPPPSQLSGINPPQISCVPAVGGFLPAGTYLIAASALDTGSPVRNSVLSVPVPVTIPQPSPPADTGQITVTVSWPDGSNGGEIYIARESAEHGYHFRKALLASDTSFRITDFDEASPGGPDGTVDHVAVAWSKVIHSGRWAQQVVAVTADTITFGGDGMTINQWRHGVLTLLGKLDSTQELIILNMPVFSSTESTGSSPGPPLFDCVIGTNLLGDQLPDLTTFLVPGDLLVMRMLPAFTPTSFSDPKIANPYYPGGATGVEAGHLAMVMSGPDVGDVQTIGSVGLDGDGHATIFNLADAWKIQPNDGDIVIVVEAGWGPETKGRSFAVPSRGAISGVIASPLITNLAAQTWVFIVRSQDTQDDNGADLYAPAREIYVFGSQGTRTIGTSQTMLKTDRIIDVDATGGPVEYAVLPFSQIPNQAGFVQKIDAGPSPVLVQCAAGDTINGQSSIVLANQWDYVVFFVSGNG